MPRTGGEADKLGNRYEGLWTVYAVLDLLDGDYTEMVVEPIGEEADGIEFVATTASGELEYHSIKRQQSEGNWRISRLAKTTPSGRSILGDLVAKAAPDAKVVFSSGTSATQLEELTARARKSDSLDDFLKSVQQNAELSAQFRHSIVPLCDDDQSAYAFLTRLRVRVKNESELRKDLERRIRWSLRRREGGLEDSRAVALLIGDFVLDRLGRTITPQMVWQWLKTRRLGPMQLVGDAATRERLDKLNQLYLSDAELQLINDTPIPRLEAERAVEALVEQSKSVMLEGGAGGGKSCVLAQVMRSLTDQGVPCLAIRLDQLREADRPASRLGANKGLPESPVITLGNFASDKPSVLCIDQLDAVSVVSARQQWAWDTLHELLEEARAYPQMHVLFGCRSFDLEQDARLRSLAEDADLVERISLSKLDNDTIRRAVETAGLSGPALTARQLRVLSTPLHLYLFLEGSRSGRLDFTGSGELYDRFWQDKMRAVDTEQPGKWLPAIKALCDELSDRESLSIPKHLLDDHARALDLMASHGVVTISDSDVRFFHESFFDYAFARTFETSHTDLVDWLKAGEQHLFRRSQVRQVLAFLRRNGADAHHYLDTFERLLGDPAIRFHIKQLVLDWAGALTDPIEQEWLIIEKHLDALGNQPLGAIRDSVPWFDVLNGLHRWEAWLRGDDVWRDRALWLLRQDKVLNARASVIVPLVKDASDGSDDWKAHLWNLASSERGYDSREMRELLLDLVAEGVTERQTQVPIPLRDIWSVLHHIAHQDPVYAIRVITTWFDRQFALAKRSNQVKKFSGPHLDYQTYGSGEVINAVAANAAERYVREFWPRFAVLERMVPTQWVSGNRDADRPVAQLREALAKSMRQLALDDPNELDRVLEAGGKVESRWVDYILLQSWGGNPARYGDQMVDYLLARPDERLSFSYSGWASGVDGFLAISRSAVAAASLHCSDDAFHRLDTAILEFRPRHEFEKRGDFRYVGRTAIALLRCLPFERMSDKARRRLQELERKFPNAPERGAPVEEADDDKTSMYVPSPVPHEATLLMTDEQWLSAIEKYHEEGVRWLDGDAVGGAGTLARELERATQSEPVRFARFAQRLDQSHAPVYIKAILRGLTVTEDGTHRDPEPDLVFAVVRRIIELDIPTEREVVWALRDAAHSGLPDDMLELLVHIATTAPDPQSDSWIGAGAPYRNNPLNQALNCDRGAAVVALSRLLFADPTCWRDIKPAMAAIINDHVLAVRGAAIDCLLAVIDTAREDAFHFFDILLQDADPLLGTPPVERFLNYAMYRDYPAVRPIFVRTLAARGDAAASAAKLITLAGLSEVSELAQSDAMEILELDEGARQGVAEIYARNLTDRTVGSQCEERLLKLFDDESAEVREQAARCWVYMEPNDIPRFGALMGKYVRSRAFADDDTGANMLAYRLSECDQPLPAEFCDLLEHSLEHHRMRESPDALYAHNLPDLAIRMHEQTRDHALRIRVLDSIDEMMKLGVDGVADQVSRRFER